MTTDLNHTLRNSIGLIVCKCMEAISNRTGNSALKSFIQVLEFSERGIYLIDELKPDDDAVQCINCFQLLSSAIVRLKQDNDQSIEVQEAYLVLFRNYAQRLFNGSPELSKRQLDLFEKFLASIDDVMH